MPALYVDVDGLKRINDSFGHHTGSAMIAETAVALRTVFRDSDVIARVGGDEFAILSIGNTAANADLMRERLATRVTAFNSSGERPYPLSLSVGVAPFTPGSARSVQELMREADEAMYGDKNRYRGSSHS